MAKVWFPPSEIWGDKKWVYDPEREVFRKEEEMIATGKKGIPYDEALDMLGLKRPKSTAKKGPTTGEPKTKETRQERQERGVWEKGDPFPPQGHDMQGNWIGQAEWEKEWGPDGTKAKQYEPTPAKKKADKTKK